MLKTYKEALQCVSQMEEVQLNVRANLLVFHQFF